MNYYHITHTHMYVYFNLSSFDRVIWYKANSTMQLLLLTIIHLFKVFSFNSIIFFIFIHAEKSNC